MTEPAPFGVDLLHGEVILVRTRRHWIVLVSPLALLSGAAIIFLTKTCSLAVALELDGRCYLVAGLVLLCVAAVFLIDWLTTVFILTDRRLIKVRAPLWVRSVELRLVDIERLELAVGVLGQLLDFGDILIDSAATQGGRLRFDRIPRPQGVRDLIVASLRSTGL